MSFFKFAWSLTKPPLSVQLHLERLEDRTVPATLFVNQAGSGGAFSSIQAAVTAAAPGDTIQVAAGSYREHVVVNKSLTIDGAETGIRGILHQGGESVVDGTSTDAAFNIQANNVTIDGFTVINGSMGGGAGIVVPRTDSGINILNNIINNNTIGVIVGGTNILVQGNLIENNNVGFNVLPAGGSGIYSDQGSANVTIADNQFQNNLNGAITFAQLQAPIAGNPAAALRNRNLLVTRNTANDSNLGNFDDVTNGTISFNTVNATDQFSNISIAGGVIGLTILGNNLSGGTRGVLLVSPGMADDPAPNRGVVISVGNQFSNHTIAAVSVDAGSESDTINATRNYWASPTGPTNAANPAGRGEALIDPDNNVTFAPFNIISHLSPQYAGAFLGLTAQEHFVEALYLDALGRAGSTGELDGWLATLNGSGGQLAVAQGIEGSFEGRDARVKLWYQTYLGRKAQGGEEVGWVNMLLRGQTEEQVLSQILSSPEFFNRAQTLSGTSGTMDERFVQALYLLLLGRAGNANEVAGGVNMLPMLGRQGVAQAFMTSKEYRTDLFEGYYNVLLHRNAETPGLNGFASSAQDEFSVRLVFESSPEFFANG